MDDPPAYSEKQNPCDRPGTDDQQDEYFIAIKKGSSANHPQKKTCPNDGLELREFRFLQPVALRSFKKFFSLPLHGSTPNCDSAAKNFNYNLWYFQLNYALLFALTVLVAMQWIHFREFSLEVYFTIVLLGLLYFVYNLGFHVKALGRKVKLSEQFAVIITLMVLYNGFLPDAFDFIYFFGGYVLLVVIHASINNVGSFYHANYTVYHI